MTRCPLVAEAALSINKPSTEVSLPAYGTLTLFRATRSERQRMREGRKGGEGCKRRERERE